MPKPREMWQPALGHVFGVRPCDMADLTPDELEAMCDYLNALASG
jgi:hypothetical protein